MKTAKIIKLPIRRPSNNILFFPTKESESLTRIKKYFKLLSCNKTKTCILNREENPFACPCYDKCHKHKDVLKVFI